MFSLRHASALILSFLLLCPLGAGAWERGDVEKFATLPAGNANPEGLTVDAHGNLYATTFAPTAPAGQLGRLFVFNPHGQLLRQVSIAGSSSALLGLGFHPQTGVLLVIDLGNAKVLSVDPTTGNSSVFATVTGPAGLNALTFDQQGNVYISDSFQGIIWKTGPGGGAAVAWVTSALLTTTGVPGFGANGVGFNKAFSSLFVANTGNDTIVEIPVSGGTPGAPAVLTNSINGADGLILDSDDNIWVAANQADEIVVIDKTGKVIAKLGDFDGIDKHGAPIGLLFPASPVQFGGWLYVTNLSLDLRNVGGPQTVDSQWADKVTSHTIARIRARIPHVRD
ncbi:MAG TPA: SMP-30/gluconolactonase/LRE family protein [Casimicrobiaceae bacterium]|nr:SMP-30/gluconolactonase/LRE family protein [Casimicrobiaceae bacterium]